jgi:hypothetical protein
MPITRRENGLRPGYYSCSFSSSSQARPAGYVPCAENSRHPERSTHGKAQSCIEQSSTLGSIDIYGGEQSSASILIAHGVNPTGKNS